MDVPYIDLSAQYRESRTVVMEAVERVLESGRFVLGPEVQAFETSFASVCDTEFAVGVANGTDALTLVLKALGVSSGDEVVTVPNSFIASAAAIVEVGAKPVFVDVLQDQNMNPQLFAEALTSRTKAVMPVHLTGKSADMSAIRKIADEHGIHIVEDAAQSIMATHKGRPVGSHGAAGCFSLHPLKNLNAFGDGGVITTDSEELASRLKELRNHGLIDRDTVREWGTNSRLDEVQAAVLNARLPELPEIIDARRSNAALYTEMLTGVVECPEEDPESLHTYHVYVIQCDERDDLQRFLSDRGIGTRVHYPIPIHLQPAAADLAYSAGDFPVAERQAGRILSLPIHQHLLQDQVEYVAVSVCGFYGV